MTRYFAPLKGLPGIRKPAKPKPPNKPKLAQTNDPYWLSFAYRITPGPSDKFVRDAVNLFFNLQKTYPAITLPEAVYWQLCLKNQVEFTYQAIFNGGRAQLNGGVPDFWLPDYRMVILIQGIYWHLQPQARERDLALIQAMKQGTIDGAPINGVVQVSDIRIQSLQRDEIFQLSLVGIEIFP